MPVVLLRIPPEPEQVRTARLVAGAAARRSGVEEECLDEVRLAVGEACARAVIRHQSDAIGEDVLVELHDDNEHFAVFVHDRGSTEDGDSDDSLALALISALAPESAVEADARGSIVKMTWPVEAPVTDLSR